jgi:fluoride exporter
MSPGLALLVGLAVAAGGAAGSVVRVAVQRYLAYRRGRADLPYVSWGTFAVNMGGTFLAGVLFTVFGTSISTAEEILLGLLLVGLLGAATSMSDFAVEAVSLARGGHMVETVGYVMLTLGGAMLALLAGIWAPVPLL